MSSGYLNVTAGQEDRNLGESMLRLSAVGTLPLGAVLAVHWSLTVAFLFGLLSKAYSVAVFRRVGGPFGVRPATVARRAVRRGRRGRRR